MSGRRSRSKGKRGELEACEALKDVWPGLKRIYGQARANSSSPDIDAPGCPVFIEVKRQESINVHAAMEQALDASFWANHRESRETFGCYSNQQPPPRPPVIVHKRNRGEWLLTVRVADIAALLRRDA